MAVFETESSSGKEQTLAVYICVEEWGVVTSVVAMCASILQSKKLNDSNKNLISFKADVHTIKQG